MYNNGYVRLTALRRDAMPFSPTLRFRSSPFEGGDVPLRSVFCHSERSDESPPFPREIPHYVRNDKGVSKSIFIQAYSPQKKQNRGINTPPLRNGTEIKRVFSLWLEND